jgi:glycosyltransferase involved in cell wall biosynthesis
VHEYVGQLYGPEAQRRSVVIPFGVRMETMAQYEQPALCRAARPTIPFVGHIHPFRNPVNLVRAMALVVQRAPQARLILAGRTDLTEPVQVKRELGLTDDQVQFLGETPHEQVVALMKTPHVLASWATGPFKSLGTAPMEAMLCETPVIQDVPEDLFGKGALRNGENIVLVNSRDPQSIATGLVRLLTDDAFRRQIGAGGRRFVQEHLSWAKIVEQMEQFYAHVLAEHAKAR